MEKLTMCRICLVENVCMFKVVNKNLHELYEKLTDVPFVTEDSRPLLACFICFTKLKQCYQLLNRCMEAEKFFTQMMNGNNKSLIISGQLVLRSGFIRTPIDTINIVGGECGDQIESMFIKQELPAYYEILDDTIEPKEKHPIDEVQGLPPHHSKPDPEYYEVPLMEFNFKVEEEQAGETGNSTVTKKPKLEETITANHEEDEQAHASIARNQHLTTEHVTTFKEPFADTQPAVNDSINAAAVNSYDINSHGNVCKEKPHKCNMCPRSFGRSSDLKKHIRRHSSEQPYKCDICHRRFTMKGDLTKHSRIHTGEKPYKCDICQRCFNDKSTLNRHTTIHTGNRPYKCDICQRGYNVRRLLTNHILKHTGEHPYVCDICQRSFRQERSLRTHIRLHTGENLYKCDVCQRGFNAKGAIIRHIRIHTGEKPYKCDICQRRFTESGSLLKHNRIHNQSV